MRICFIRSDKGYPDSRVEKEMYALSKEHEEFLLGWNREKSGDGVIHEKHCIHGREYDYYLIPEEAGYGGGMKSMIGFMFIFKNEAVRLFGGAASGAAVFVLLNVLLGNGFLKYAVNRLQHKE